MRGQRLQQEVCRRKTENLLCLSLKHRPSFCRQDEAAPFLHHPQTKTKRETATVFLGCFTVILTSFDSCSYWLLGVSVSHSQPTDHLTLPVHLRVVQNDVPRLEFKEVIHKSAFVGTYEDKLATCIFSGLLSKEYVSLKTHLNSFSNYVLCFSLKIKSLMTFMTFQNSYDKQQRQKNPKLF